MLQSLQISNLILRIGLAAVFFWFGIDKFIHPNYWITAWLPSSVIHVSERVGLGASEFTYLVGIIEILIGTSILSRLFIRSFSCVAILLLVVMMFFHGFDEILIRNFGLLGGLLALIFWPDRRYYN